MIDSTLRSLVLSSVAFALLFALSPGSAHAATEQEHEAIALNALERHVRPGFAALLTAATAQQQSLDAWCAAPTAAGRSEVEAAFRATVLAYARIEHLRIGPLSEDGRAEHFAFWPDRKGLGLRQVETLLKKRDRTATDAASLAKKSVAVQGLTALEVVLHGGEGTNADDVVFRCAYARAIAANIVRQARACVDGWGEDRPYVKLWRKPDLDSEIFMNREEVSRTLFLSFLTGLKLVKDFKLAQPLGESLERAKPRAAAFWRSGLSTSVAVANVEGVRALFRIAFSAPIEARNPGGAEGVDLDFQQALFALTRLETPLGEAAADASGRKALEDVKAVLAKIQREGGSAAAEATDQSLGFNALDGD